jgi:archaemetzincin
MKKAFISAIPMLLLFYLSSCCNNGTTETAKTNTDSVLADTNVYIALVIYNNFDTSLARTVASNAEKFYSVKCLPFVHTTLPKDAYNAAWARYSADSLLVQLKKIKPSNADFIQGLTDQDIFTPTEKSPYWGIFGLGSFVNPTSVVSTFRLHAGNCSEEKFKERLIKVALHELGHNLGLEHCPSLNCMMESANGTITTVDNEKIAVCDQCKKQLQEKFRSLRHD